MNRKIRNDIFLFATILLVAVIVFVVISFSAADGYVLEITVDGKLYGHYSLFESQTIDLGDNVLVIENGTADMISAGCPDKLCVKQRTISKVGESIVCLPNRVIVTILGDAEIDIVVR